MSEKANHHDFPDKVTLLEYLKGGLTLSERYRIEKLMLEHDFFREIVEGLESESTEKVEKDLDDLSSSIHERSGYQTPSRFNFYRLAATISLIVMTSVIIYVMIDWISGPETGQELSFNQPPAETPAKAGSQERINIEPVEPLRKRSIPDDEPGPEMEQEAQIREKQTEPLKENEPLQENEISESRDIGDLPEKKIDDRPLAGRSAEKPAPPEETTTLHASKSVSAETKARKETVYLSNDTVSAGKTRDAISAAVPAEYEAEMDEAGGQVESVVAQRIEVIPTGSQTRPVIGYNSYNRYLQEQLKYPVEALENQVEGVVMVSFTIDRDSIPENVNIQKSLGYGCDEEAIRLIREGPKWIPHLVGGNIVESEMTMPVRFTLPEDN